MSWWSTASLTWLSSTKGKSLLEAIRLDFEAFYGGNVTNLQLGPAMM